MSSTFSPSPGRYPSANSRTTASEPGGILFSREMTIYLRHSDALIMPTLVSQNTMQLKVQVESRLHELRKCIDIQVENRADPFFLFTYTMDAHEFDKLKHSHQMVISFEEFPEKLKNQLEKCAATSSNISDTSYDKSSLILCMRYIPKTELQLDIVERNEIRHMVRLSLVLPAANEEFIRARYLDTYRRLTRENEDLTREVARLETDISSLTLKNAQEAQKFAHDLNSRQRYFEDKVRDVERRAAEDRERLQESERTLKARLDKVQTELRTKEEMLYRENQESGRSYKELKESCSEELAGKIVRIKELEERNRQLTSEADYQKSLREKTSQLLKKNECELESVRRDLTKANEIIRKLQEEVKSSRGKLGILNQVAHRQEANIDARETNVEKLSTDLKAALQLLKTKDKHIDRLETELELCRAKCSQSELQIKANKGVMAKMSAQFEAMQERLAAMTIQCQKPEPEEQQQPKRSSSSEQNARRRTCPVLAKEATTHRVLDRNHNPKSQQSTTTTTHDSLPSKPNKKATTARDDQANKNVDFRFDDRDYTQIGARDRHQHITHLKEVNLRTNKATTRGNVLPSSRR